MSLFGRLGLVFMLWYLMEALALAGNIDAAGWEDSWIWWIGAAMYVVGGSRSDDSS